MDEQQLAEIEARVNASTSGEWVVLTPIQRVVMVDAEIDTPDPDDLVASVGLMVGPLPPGGASIGCAFLVLADDPERDDIRADPLWRDADFVAHAHQDVPALVAEVRRLNQTIADLRNNWPGRFWCGACDVYFESNATILQHACGVAST